jgi:PHIKZ131|nr:MAG TPA: structural protein [Caudoviricetes sp.]
MLQRYPYDPTGRSPDNLVRIERHVVTIDGNNVFFPRYGAYFNDSLVVKQGEKTLVLNQDYQLSFFWQDATIQVGKPISLAFNFINDKIIGEIQIDYQVVGGEWAGSVEAIEQLKQNPPDKHRNVFWDEVIGKPEAWQPTRHIHHVNDVYGLTPLVLAVEDMKRSLENQSVLKLKSVYDRFLKLKQYVEANIANSDDVGQALKNYSAQMEEKLKSISDRNEVERLIAEAKSQTLRKVDEKYDPRVQALETNKEEVARTLTTLANEGRDLLAKINANKANIATNRRDIDALKQKQQSDIDTLTTKVNQNNEDQHNAIQRLDTKTTTELARVENQLASATNTLNDKLTEKESALTASINEKVGALTNRINEVSSGAQNDLNRLIENEKNERVAAITAMNEGLTQYKNTQAQIDRAQNERIDGAEAKNREQDTRLDGLNKKVTDNKEAQDAKNMELSNRIDHLTESTQTVDASKIIGLEDTIAAKIVQNNDGEVNRRIQNAISQAHQEEADQRVAAKEEVTTNVLAEVERNYLRKTMKNGEAVTQRIDNPLEIGAALTFRQDGEEGSLSLVKKDIEIPNEPSSSSATGENPTGEHPEGTPPTGEGTQPPAVIPPTIRHVTGLKINAPGGNLLVSDGKIWNTNKDPDSYLPTKREVDQLLSNQKMDLHLENYVTKHQDEEINSNKTFLKDKKLILNAAFLNGTDEGLNVNDQYYLVGDKLYKGNGRQDNYLITKAEVDSIGDIINDNIDEVNRNLTTRIDGLDGKLNTEKSRINQIIEKNTSQDQALENYKTEQAKKLTALEGKIDAASSGAAGSLDTAIEKVKEDTAAKINAAITDRINPAISTAKTEAIAAASTQAQQAINGFKTTQDADNASKYFRKSKNGDQTVPQTIENPTTFKDTVSFNSGNKTASISTGNNGLTLTGNDGKSVVVKDGKVYTGNKGNNDYLLTKSDVDGIVSSNNNSLNLNQYLTKGQDETITSNKTFSKDKKLILNASFMKGTDEGINLNDQYYLVGDKLYKGNDRLDNYLITKAEVQPLLTALQNTVNNDIKTKLAELESELAKKPNHADVDPEVLKRQVKKELDSHIAEARANAADDDHEAVQRLPEYIVHPDAPNTNVTGNPDGGFRVEGIVYMNPNESHQEYYRAVFTPTTELEWTSNNTWVIPDIYDGLVAQVFVTSGIRIEGGNKIKSPSTKMRYVKLVGGQSVPITVGSISSFGSWLTNDGVDTKNVIYPSMVIPSIPGITYQPGQHAKVLVIV